MALWCVLMPTGSSWPLVRQWCSCAVSRARASLLGKGPLRAHGMRHMHMHVGHVQAILHGLGSLVGPGIAAQAQVGQKLAHQRVAVAPGRHQHRRKAFAKGLPHQVQAHSDLAQGVLRAGAGRKLVLAVLARSRCPRGPGGRSRAGRSWRPACPWPIRPGPGRTATGWPRKERALRPRRTQPTAGPGAGGARWRRRRAATGEGCARPPASRSALLPGPARCPPAGSRSGRRRW